jgi:hypothetical protein
LAGAHRLSPVDPLQQHRQLRPRQHRHTRFGARPSVIVGSLVRVKVWRTLPKIRDDHRCGYVARRRQTRGGPCRRATYPQLLHHPGTRPKIPKIVIQSFFKVELSGVIGPQLRLVSWAAVPRVRLDTEWRSTCSQHHRGQPWSTTSASISHLPFPQPPPASQARDNRPYNHELRRANPPR